VVSDDGRFKGAVDSFLCIFPRWRVYAMVEKKRGGRLFLYSVSGGWEKGRGGFFLSRLMRWRKGEGGGWPSLDHPDRFFVL